MKEWKETDGEVKLEEMEEKLKPETFRKETGGLSWYGRRGIQ